VCNKKSGCLTVIAMARVAAVLVTPVASHNRRTRRVLSDDLVFHYFRKLCCKVYVVKILPYKLRCFLKTLLNDFRLIHKSNAHIALELFAEAL
jgi:hypothetical protein